MSKITEHQRSRILRLALRFATHHLDAADDLIHYIESLLPQEPSPIKITTKVVEASKVNARFDGPHPSTTMVQSSLTTAIYRDAPSLETHQRVAQSLVRELELNIPFQPLQLVAETENGYIFEVRPAHSPGTENR